MSPVLPISNRKFEIPEGKIRPLSALTSHIRTLWSIKLGKEGVASAYTQKFPVVPFKYILHRPLTIDIVLSVSV